MEKEMIRCGWCGTDPLYVKYHDDEWGREVTDDRILFEFLLLESAQAGLSWITILRKRENYRKAFDGFDPEKIAGYTNRDIERLMADEGIVRNRKKIESTISNAKHFLELQKESGSFYAYLKGFFPEGKVIVNHLKTYQEAPASTPLSDKISSDMKKRGFKFFGTTVCYAFLQAVGFIDDHIVNCWVRNA